MKNKNIILFGISFLLIIFLTGLISSASACCQRTNAGEWCQNVIDSANCNDDYIVDENTACASTDYCSTGTCINRGTGECTQSTDTRCDPSLGGYFDQRPSDEIPECQLGCCITGQGGTIVEQVLCNTIGSDYNLRPTWRSDITDSATCSELAGSRVEGACIFETNEGRDCSILTRESCTDKGGDEFHEGLLCTAPELGTICGMTKRTSCRDGRNEVYFLDQCDNYANVYDANKVEDIGYWTYIQDPTDPEETCGVGSDNKNSQTCGNCNYILGSICREGNAQYGDFICQDLGCKSGDFVTEFKSEYDDRTPEHGEEWCVYSDGKPYNDFGNFGEALPGELSYLAYCYDGEVLYESCGNFRDKICQKNVTTGGAGCQINDWQSCWLMTNAEDCLAEERDCRLEPGVSRTYQNGTDIFFLEEEVCEDFLGVDNIDCKLKKNPFHCVPKYPPALDFWNPKLDGLPIEEGTENICGTAITSCSAGFRRYYDKTELRDNWEAYEWECYIKCEGDTGCIEDCPDTICYRDTLIRRENLPEELKVSSVWIKDTKEMCIPTGDCGVTTNYKGYASSNNWKDFFSGQIDKGNILNDGPGPPGCTDILTGIFAGGYRCGGG